MENEQDSFGASSQYLKRFSLLADVSGLSPEGSALINIFRMCCSSWSLKWQGSFSTFLNSLNNVSKKKSTVQGLKCHRVKNLSHQNCII